MMPINLGYYNKMKANKAEYEKTKKASLDKNGNTITTNIPTATPSPVQQSRFTNANAPTSIQPNTTTQAQKLADTMAAYDRQGKQLKAEAYAQYRANRDATRNQIAQSYQSYQNQQATAGANAEQLKAMGMTGSGYTDYMNSQNYGAYRQNVGNAYNTQAYNDTSVANTLQTNMNALEQAKIQTQAAYDTAKAENYSDAYTNILNAVNDGTYNDSMLDVLTSGGYIDENQKATLSAMAKSQMEKNNVANSNSALVDIAANTANYNIQTIDALFDSGKLSKEDYEQAIEARQKYSQKTYDAQIASTPADYNINNLLTLLDDNEISVDYFNSKMQGFLQTNMFDASKLTLDEANEAYDVFAGLYAEGKLTNKTMSKITDYHDEYVVALGIKDKSLKLEDANKYVLQKFGVQVAKNYLGEYCMQIPSTLADKLPKLKEKATKNKAGYNVKFADEKEALSVLQELSTYALLFLGGKKYEY